MGIQARVARNCNHCGKEFQARVDAINAGGGKYCGQSCSANSRRVPDDQKAPMKRKTVVRNCDHCQKPYEARLDSIEKGMGRYCGRDCHFAVRRSVRVKMACLACGVEFEVIPAQLKNGRGKYCSDPCSRSHCHTKTPIEERFWVKVEVRGPDECWPWKGGTSTFGHGRIAQQQASRVSWEIHNGPIPDGLWVLHRCDNPPCCNPAHLFLGDNAVNTQDKVNKGRQRRGETAPMAKLTEDRIRDIRRMREAGEPVKVIAAKHGVQTQAIYKILWGTRWKHVV